MNATPRWALLGACLVAPSLAACTSRPAHIPSPSASRVTAGEAAAAAGHAEAAQDARAAAATPRLRAPDSRAEVLRLLALFQSSIVSGDPPLEQLLSASASLSAPGVDGRRTSPNRAQVMSALEASFIDRELTLDPLEVCVQETARGSTATVPLLTSGSTGRRMSLALGLGYQDGTLRITDIKLERGSSP